jgi:hypothetical protein
MIACTLGVFIDLTQETAKILYYRRVDGSNGEPHF